MKSIKSNKGITNATLLIIVLIIIVLMLLVAIIYLVKNPNTTYITQNAPTEQQTVNLSNIEEEKLTTTTEIKTEKVEMTSDEKYKIFVQNLKKGIANLEEDTTVGGNYSMPYDNLGSYSLDLDSNGNLSIQFTDEKLEETYATDKLATDIIAYYNIFIGQDASRVLYVIKSDGTLWRTSIEPVCWEENYQISFEKESKYKNIVSIVGSFGPGAMQPLFIDIEGKIFE